jgi:ATP-binding cassette subfamily F protein 3
MVRIENLTKSYGDRVIFEDISFAITARERLGLVGRNGHGKTTLLRLITGEETPDCGSIIIPKNYRIGYVQQDLNFTADTALMEGVTALPIPEPDHYWKVEKVLAGLGFSAEDFHRHPLEFSGGFQVRLNLAKAMISEPDLLLLDEPTNFLDITSIRWIEQFLCNWPHELVLITHDRSFMDKVVTHTMGIHRRKVRKIPGNTAKYYDQIAQDEEIYEKTRLNDDRRRKDIEQFITRFRAKARLANLVQSRIKTLQKMEKKEKLEKLKTLEFSFRSIPMAGNHVLSARHLNFAYDQQSALIRGFNITVGPGERVCVVGKNGKGKTTLLKLLAGEMRPQGGDVAYHPSVKLGFFEQTNTQSLVDTRTVEEEILYSHTDVDRQLARNICGAMLFTGDEALKKVSVLSGGEKSRVMLGKLLVTPLNLLMLDEPSNHLDMESCDALLAAIDSFEGAVIMVTHNEMFLHTLAERLIVFQNDTIELFNGRYQEFLESGGWVDELSPAASERTQPPVNAGTTKRTKKEMRRRRSEIVSRRSKVVKPLEERISRLENDILVRETELHHLNDLIQKASREQDGLQIAELSRAIHSCQSSIDQLFVELEHATNELDTQNVAFEQQLQELESD